MRSGDLEIAANLADLVAGTGDRPQRLDRSFAALRARENASVRGAMSRLSAIPGVRMLGALTLRTGALGFTLDARVPGDVAAQLGERDICVWSGHACAWELTRALGDPPDWWSYPGQPLAVFR